MTTTPTQTALIEMLVDILFDLLESHAALAIRVGHNDIALAITSAAQKHKAQCEEGPSK